MNKFFLAALAFSISMVSFSSYANNTSNATYKIAFGYGVFNLSINSSQPISNLVFDYGNSNFKLNAWGAINSNNATITKKDLNNGLFRYTITPKDKSKNFGTSVSFDQTPLMTSSPPPKNMSFTDYYGLFQNIKVNGSPIKYADQCQDNACQNPAPGKLLGGYYADWTVYNGHGGYKPTELPFGNLNTIYYAFGSLDPLSGQAEMFDPYADAQMTNVNAVPYLSLMRQKYPYLNLIYSFGGWGSISHDNFQSGDFSVLFTYYPQDIPKLANSMISAMLRTGFNGIDVDYEWAGPFESDPKRLGGNAPLCNPNPNQPKYCSTIPLSQAEADGYATLIYDLRQDLNKLPNGKNDLLTVALFSGVDKIDNLASFKYQGPIASLKGQSDLKIIMDNVTHADLMTYDMHGAFDASPKDHPNPDSISNFQSRFKPSPDDPTVNKNIRQYNVVDAVKALEKVDPNDKNFPSSKIVVGIPAYSRIVKLSSQPKNPTPYQQKGIFDQLAPFNQQAVLKTDVSGEFEGDDTYQFKNGGGDIPVGSTIFDYKCILTFPNDASSSDCYYKGFSGSHPIPKDMKFYGMNKLPTNDQPGSYAATPWGYGNQSRTFMSFDNNLSAANKTHYVIDNHLGGAMIWELDGDVSPTNQLYKSKSIVYAMCSVFHGSPCDTITPDK